MARTLEDKLPPDNPLRAWPFWDGPESNNLDALKALEWLEAFILTMDAELPCHENRDTLWHVRQAIKSQKERIIRRKEQGVYGLGKPHEFTVVDPYRDGD